MRAAATGYWRNTFVDTHYFGAFWIHTYVAPHCRVVRSFADKSLIEYQGQQRARDGTVRLRIKKPEGS